MDLRSRYLELLRGCLTRTVVGGEAWLAPKVPKSWAKRLLWWPVLGAARVLGLKLVEKVRFDPTLRQFGSDWPSEGETMIGVQRLENLGKLVESVVKRKVPGDLVEAGAWRGGASIYMRGVLEAYGGDPRSVWVCDSFEGFPEPNPDRYPADVAFLNRSWDMEYWTRDILVVPLEEVKANFARYGFLDDRVRFVKGWFKDTLSGAPIKKIALLRVDADLYESTYEALEALYPRVSSGGFVVVDDYFSLAPTKQAVLDYRSGHGVTEPLRRADWNTGYWQKVVE